jgi:putative DNA methylase
LESWRKEVNRPIYHVHKWWANRLGSVFRAIALAGNLDAPADVWQAFYHSGHHFPGCIVLDPFMGSGTTVGEALKLGCRAVGVDINPVSYFQVRKAIEPCDEAALRRAMGRLEREVAPQIREYYRSTTDGIAAEILYTFWVKVLACPDCGGKSRLFNKWIFAANAFPKRKPESWAVCPGCGAINQVLYTATAARCCECGDTFAPQRGPARGQFFSCEQCGREHRVVEAVRRSSDPPAHEMYALLLLLPDGRKAYKRPDDADRKLYDRAARALRRGTLPIPLEEIPPGHNTDQARGYNYRFWHQMFNPRQLYALGTLLAGILREPDRNVRENLLLLFSGTLEFNNMFCSFKGEGTGAVRHLFHHHILKPERTPLEANPWGTEKSSGAFTTLFERRLLAARRYCAAPFELRAARKNGRLAGEKVHGLSPALRPRPAADFAEIAGGRGDVLLLAGDSSKLPIPDAAVDLVITDPPYFDNVHYSELADFFYCWLRQGLEGDEPSFRAPTTRSASEVQGADAGEFGARLGGVFTECARVLKPGGLLAFTFHHARLDAWLAASTAIGHAGFEVVAAYPVKAEMAGAFPKSQAKHPIRLDLIVVCKHRTGRGEAGEAVPAEQVWGAAEATVRRYNTAGIELSRGDIRVILMGSVLKARRGKLLGTADPLLAGLESQVDRLQQQVLPEAPLVNGQAKRPEQRRLFDEPEPA